MQTVIVTTTVKVPEAPPHFMMSDGQLLPLDAITEDGLVEIGIAYGQRLVEAARSRRPAACEQSASTLSSRRPDIDINANPRMIALDADFSPVTPGQHVVVFMPDFGLMFDARPPVRYTTHAKALEAARSCDLLGFDDWRAGTVKEQLLAVDRTRVEPAAYTDYFPNTPSSGWLWSEDVYASDSSSAWGVGFSLGGVPYGTRDDSGFVRAVRRVPASQSVGL